MRKILISLLCALALPVLAAAQTPRITLDASGGVSLKAVMEELEVQSGYSFFYDQTAINTSVKVSVKLSGADLNDALAAVFKGLGVEYKVVDGNILLKPAAASKGTTGIVFNGRVVDEEDNPVTGAMVVSLKDKTSYAVTDIDGNFSIHASAGEEFEITCLGFVTMQCKASSSEAMLRLRTDRQLLDEVVVVGYGVQKKSDITGAISSVETEQIKKVPTSSIAEMLRGSVAGVQVNLGSAAPGGTSSILIRGRRSLSAENTPLYVVDGAFMRNIDELDSSDIEEMEVLKDAAAQAIYGARAANGVILIRTKSGSNNQKAKVSYDGYVSVQTLNRNFEYWDFDSWCQYRETAYVNYYGTYDESQCYGGDLLRAKNEGAYLNWEKIMMHPALQHKHNLSVQGGGSQNKYSVSLGYYNQDGMLPYSNYERFSGRVNFTQNIGKHISFGLTSSLSRANKTSIDGTFTQYLETIPIGFLYEDDGTTLRRNISGFAENATATNPLWNIRESQSKSITDRLNAIAWIDVKIIDGLTYRLNVNYDTRVVQGDSYYSTKHINYEGVGGKASVNKERYQDWLLENIVNYTKDFKSGHHFDATLMQSISGTDYNTMTITGQGMVNDTYGADAVGSALEFAKPSYGISRRRLASFMGRVRYSYDERYLFSAAVRVDGSSVFGDGNKWGVFPSVSAAWRINKEPWMKDASKWLSNLKLRFSYGEVGNQAVSPYTTLGTTSLYYNEFTATQIGFLPDTKLYNPKLKWETSATVNLGLDFGFFDGRLSGTVELYNTDTRDLLVTRQLPSSTGYTSQLSNLGKVNNRGIEITLDTTPLVIGDFQWDINLTWSMNRNKIIAIDGSVDENGKPVNDLNNNWFIGKPISVYRYYKMIGIWQQGQEAEILESNMPAAKPGDIRLADLNDNKQIDEEDKILYNRDPDWIAGLVTNLSWKGIDVSLAFDGQMGGYVKNSVLYSGGGTLSGRTGGVKRDYWTPENPINTAPAPVMQSTPPAYMDACGFQKASYIRLRNATLGYNFPKKLIKRAKMSSLRLYVSGTNLWYSTKVLSYGPGAVTTAYPQSRSFLFGLKVSF